MQLVANGIGQYYHRQGTGPPLVLIHALGLDHRMWEGQVAAFSSKNTVIAYDARGHGQTDVPNGPYAISDFADDLQGLLDALGIESAHLVGISMGGMIAQEFALTRSSRVRSLVLADTTSEYHQDARRQFAERARVVEERGIAPLVGATLERWFTSAFRDKQPNKVEQIRQVLAEAHPMGYAASCRAIAAFDLTELLVNIQVPSLVVVGSDDTSTNPEMALRIHEHIPGSSYRVISDAAHLTNVAAPEEFVRLVSETVRRGEPLE